ncbi:transposase [Streptomyces europaeiscabiei]|uniref:transposase n=1 Tax=Streptomyces europaeiscabiei TaxID=146819 RepID=UPI002E1297A1
MPASSATGPGTARTIFYRLHVYHGRKGEPKTFAWHEYRDLIITAHQQLDAPLVWCWDNLNVHLAKELVAFAEEHADWLRIFQMPSYAPELNPAEGVWSLLKRAIANFVATDIKGLVRIVKRRLKKIQFRPHLIDGCLTGTGLIIEPGDHTAGLYEFNLSTWRCRTAYGAAPNPRPPYDNNSRTRSAVCWHEWPSTRYGSRSRPQPSRGPTQPLWPRRERRPARR